MRNPAKTAKYLGIEIGGTKLQVVVGQPGRIGERRRVKIEPALGAAGIRRQIEQLIPGFVDADPPLAVGVGFGGPVDWRSGTICRSHQIEGWSGFHLAPWLHELTGAQVFADNDANVAALGEATHGAGVGFDPVFYVTLGSGVGGGLACRGEIYHGTSPGEAEIGHLRLDRQGTIVESLCSGWAMDAKIRALKETDPQSLLSRLASEAPGGEARHLAAALRQNDAPSQRILQETAENLAYALSHVVHLFHPQIIILGGGLSGIGEPLRAAVEGSLRQFVMDAFIPGLRVALSALGEDAVPTGALVLAQSGLVDGCPPPPRRSRAS